MKTIEERATEYARSAQNCERCGEEECLQENFRCDHFRRVYYAFINGAKEQRKIDIEKACDWLKARNVLTDASLEGFRKVMEE